MSGGKAVTWKEIEASILALEHNGTVDPNDLIEAARNSKHPCHSKFTWDIEQAAAERWRDQARALIRQCKFEVLVDSEVTERVVRYVESPGDDYRVFSSLPKMRSVTKVSVVMASEVAMLHGLACRVRGIAVSKSGVVGASVISRLSVICDQLAILKEELGN